MSDEEVKALIERLVKVLESLAASVALLAGKANDKT